MGEQEEEMEGREVVMKGRNEWRQMERFAIMYTNLSP